MQLPAGDRAPGARTGGSSRETCLAHRVKRDAGLDQEARIAVPEIVEEESGQAGLVDGALEICPEGRRLEGSAVDGPEEVAASKRAGECPQGRGEALAHLDDAVLAVLRVPEGQQT